MNELEISAQDARERIAAGDAVLIDVRTPAEWDEGRIPGAEHIELAELTDRAAEVPRDKLVVFQCHVGSRSLMAAQAFRGAGYDAVSMAGGIEAWQAAGLPVEDGHVADR